MRLFNPLTRSLVYYWPRDIDKPDTRRDLTASSYHCDDPSRLGSQILIAIYRLWSSLIDLPEAEAYQINHAF